MALEEDERQEVPHIDEDALEKMREVTRAKFFQDLSRPEMSESLELSTTDGIGKHLAFTPHPRELKTSNITHKEALYLGELSDLAAEFFNKGYNRPAFRLLNFRDTTLALSMSKYAKFMNLATTSQQVSEVREGEQKRGGFMNFFRNE